jgi:hypothetical protein
MNRHGLKVGYSCGTLAPLPAGFIVAFRSAKGHPCAERKATIPKTRNLNHAHEPGTVGPRGACLELLG